MTGLLDWLRPRPPGARVARLLDAWALPWQTPRGDLVRRYGVQQHPAYEWPVIAVPDVLAGESGLLHPVWTHHSPEDAPGVPAVDWSASLWLGDDVDANLAHAERLVARHLGAGEEAGVSNTRAWRWRDGPASVDLTVWPRELNRGGSSNPSERREPRLRTACSVQIGTGYRPALSPDERAALATFVPVAALPAYRPPTPRTVRDAPPPGRLLEYVRAPAEDLAPVLGRVGHDAARRTVLACTDQLYVVPAERVAVVHVERVSPGRGGGESRMAMICRAGHDASVELAVPLARHGDTYGLDALAARVAEALGVALRLGEPYPES